MSEQLQQIIINDYLTEMSFDSLEPIEVLVKAGGKRYILREADEAASVAWRNSQVRALRMVDGKLTGLGDVANSEPLILSRCLMEEAGRKPVPIETINTWKSSIVKALFERLKKISDLGEEETVEVLEKRIAEDTEKLAKLRSKDQPKKELTPE